MSLYHKKCPNIRLNYGSKILYGALVYFNFEPTSKESPLLQSQIQAVSVLSFLYPSSISFRSFIFLGAPYWIFLLFLPWLPCQFHLVVIKQQHVNLVFAYAAVRITSLSYLHPPLLTVPKKIIGDENNSRFRIFKTYPSVKFNLVF